MGAKSTAHVGDHSRLTGPQLKEHGTGIRSPPLVAERSTRHAATSGERPQKKDGAKNAAKQRCRYRKPMQQITHISKTEEKLRLLLLLSPFIGIRPTRQTADCKTHSNLAKTWRGRPTSKEQWGTSDKCMNKNHNRIVGDRPLMEFYLGCLKMQYKDFHNLPNLRWHNRSSQLTALGSDPLLDCKKVRDLQHFRCKLCCSSHLICNKTILK